MPHCRIAALSAAKRWASRASLPDAPGIGYARHWRAIGGLSAAHNRFMCNLYHMSPKDDFEIYVRRHIGKLWLPEVVDDRVGAGRVASPVVIKPTVGPFDTGFFLRAVVQGGRLGVKGEWGQWGLIRPGAPSRRDMVQPKAVPGKKTPAPRPRSTNNARAETVATLPTFREAWRSGRRCLIPASWYQEPNWETGRNRWWQLRRADGLPWMLAGLWNEWIDPVTGELVPSYTLLTCNCDDHPLLRRLHRPDPKLPPQAQDKRAVIHIEPQDWMAWMGGDEAHARALMHPPPAEFFDLSDAQATDALLRERVFASPDDLPDHLSDDGR
ncbi:SOS response-associated peptidase [Roseateles amylovorans]|uniref:Abasic site processing protein n=1 Tax=Roseateles amylovorans TaxID=2978473 RepID=A0ABY6AXH9_9BURK|nr:SOS response-associated peptidase [Roseateles amylovorans]UXH76459.1 SOS response-associated peptidase [Roseateles amylovorans]